MKYTIDASVLVKAVVDEEHSEKALKIISEQKAVLYAPNILFSEVGSVLYKMSRRGIIERSYAIKAYENLVKLPIEIQAEDLSLFPSVLDMSLKLGLHFYDCLYIQTARKTGSMLLSSDRKLLDIASKECTVKSLQDI
ncbi:type II toxin-antitoxin system VapC family toxin [Nitrososphaera sp.]|uniref:type II toxin-antitoxin system VapC family toxin n=1 Tax=Nitrososphaera sp. TaxID=1971748 RepID=UPI0017BEC7A9|nr:type II toxin-antitoxin system VapC family toxin [Nitrososphaera sp.]NWG36290.1 type II toxin-antitoxin system VapC family toxin [Nitrososphaera sp.]